MLDIDLLAASGRLFDNHYKLIRPLSTDGGTADVWLALDMKTVRNPDSVGSLSGLTDEDIEQLGLIVAIKIYRPQNALDVEGEQRFRDEYMIVFNCHHTNLIHPTHFSIFHETPYLVLPYCKRGSSEKLIGRMTDTDTIWKYIGDVASGLAYLHDLNPPIVHQDVKPGNVLIDDSENYSITDFGISAKSGRPGDNYLAEERSGTMAYMAPERFHEGNEPSPAGDIWGFGATLFELITGNVPFGEEGGWTQVQQQRGVPAIAGIPAEVQRLIDACLDPDPTKRPTAHYLAKAAEARQFPVKKRRPWINILALTVALLAIGSAAFFYFSKSEPEIIEIEAPATPPEEIYPDALAMLNSNDSLTMQKGVTLMDSLAGLNYVPAIYEMAFTYGWYSDSVSVARKRLLGIDIDNSYMPIRNSYSNMAVGLFTEILKLNDSTYADINANAAYRLACYYVMPNNIYKPDYERGKKYLLQARSWALLTGDMGLLERIDNGLATFQ